MRPGRLPPGLTRPRATARRRPRELWLGEQEERRRIPYGAEHERNSTDPARAARRPKTSPARIPANSSRSVPEFVPIRGLKGRRARVRNQIDWYRARNNVSSVVVDGGVDREVAKGGGGGLQCAGFLEASLGAWGGAEGTPTHQWHRFGGAVFQGSRETARSRQSLSPGSRRRRAEFHSGLASGPPTTAADAEPGDGGWLAMVGARERSGKGRKARGYRQQEGRTDRTPRWRTARRSGRRTATLRSVWLLHQARGWRCFHSVPAGRVRFPYRLRRRRIHPSPASRHYLGPCRTLRAPGSVSDGAEGTGVSNASPA